MLEKLLLAATVTFSLNLLLGVGSPVANRVSSQSQVAKAPALNLTFLDTKPAPRNFLAPRS